MLRPSNELVATAWLQAIPDLNTEVGTDLPKNLAAFVQVTVVGGTPEMYLLVSRPVVQIDAWVATKGSTEPPWGRASHLVSLVLAQAYETAQPLLTPGSPFSPVHVLSAYPLSEPRRIPSDEARFARVQFDLQLHWRVP
ncbi:hypothetical protein ACFYZ3_00240 [Streptomyces sp. NPDC001599]|uniref:hypothetical protein n=1 Tax=Streptomyces sp. NPDC001599 TaxID=3364591 RepID=UPI0036C90EC7